MINGQMTNDLRSKILDQHNYYRRTLVSASNMVQLEYDMKLEQVAQAYLETQGSNYIHNAGRTADYAKLGGTGYVGENWYSSSPTDAAEKWTVFVWPKSWGGNGCSEEQNYWATYESSSSNGKKYAHCKGGTVGHYTQVMWATSVKVGCGYSATAGTVCNYSPGGNVNGYTGYIKKGSACSACESGFGNCNNGLCAYNGQGSSGNSNPSSTPPAASASGGNCADMNKVCPGWSKSYSCSSTTITYNGSPMKLNKFCPKSCGTCSATTQLDTIATTAMFAMDDGPGRAVPTVELASDTASSTDQAWATQDSPVVVVEDSSNHSTTAIVIVLMVAAAVVAIGVLHKKRQQSYEPLGSEQEAEQYGSQYGAHVHAQPQDESVPELEQRSNLF